MLILEAVNGKGYFTNGKDVLTWREIIEEIIKSKDDKIDILRLSGIYRFFTNSFDLHKPAYKALFWKKFYQILRMLLRYNKKFKFTKDSEFKFRVRYVSKTKTKKLFVIPLTTITEEIEKTFIVRFGNSDSIIRHRKETIIIAKEIL